MLFAEFEKADEVALPRGEVELSALNFVQVPKDVNAERIEAQGLHGEQAVLPILPGNAWVVNLPRVNWCKLKNVIDFDVFGVLP